MLIKHTILALLALLGGVGVSAGTFAFLLVVGVIPRMLRKSNLAKRIITVENVVVCGLLLGTVLSVFSFGTIFRSAFLGHIVLAVYGLSAGIFVGCISVALAEILDTFPIMFRRTHIKRGLSWMMTVMAMGKLAGALYYFYFGFALI